MVVNALNLRKPKNLALGGKITRVSDLRVYQLSTALARAHPCVTEMKLMSIGGELYEMKKHALSQVKMGAEDASSLKVKVQLASMLQLSEHAWRERLIGLLTKGDGFPWGEGQSVPLSIPFRLRNQ